MGRKAGTDIGVNSCLVALIASETVSIALSWLLLQFWNDIVAKILSFISLPNLKPHGQSNIKLDWMAYHMELKQSSINAHDVDQQRRCIRTPS